MDNDLGIGDIICLYSEESFGFVYSTQTSSYHNGLAVGSREDRRRPPVASPHVIAFEICAPNRYKLSKQYEKLKAQLHANPENSQLKNSVTHVKIAAESEKQDNNFEQKKNQGKKIVYGQSVQLRHLFTNKYIHVSTTKTSHKEGNNMAVELQANSAKQAYFRIMPRYKVKAEGDVVQIGDQVVLESVKSPGQYLHVSHQLMGQQSVYCHSFELNLSVRQSGFTLYRKYKPSADDEQKVKAGDPVRFFHKELEAYLVAEGLFGYEPTEGVHLRLRPVDQNNPKTRYPSSSAITYWQIELQDGPVAGGVLKWEQQCRIVHMCTRRYLAVNRTGEVTLEKDSRNPSTVFRLHAVMQETGDVFFESYARIKHVVTGYWLHALADEYERRHTVQSTDNIHSMSGLPYTTAKLKKVAAIEEKQYDDAFTLQRVDGELLDIFHVMAGMVPCVQKLLQDKQRGDVLNAQTAFIAIQALREMKAFMFDQKVTSKKRQKLLRNLRVVELLVDLLQVPYLGCPDQQHLTNVFAEAYNVLCTQLIGDSRKNELYIAKHIDVFLTQFEYRAIGVYAAQMVVELIRDNRKVLDRITRSHIDTFVGHLQREKNYRYLELLGVLCVCDGVSIADNQNYITETWLASQNKNCVYLTEFGDTIGLDPKIIFVSADSGRTWKDLGTFSCGSHEDDSYLFLEKQLELFGMLCHGQNEFAIRVITQDLNYLSWTEAFTCLQDKGLPERLRAKYCELIITLFVDIPENVSVMDRVKLSYAYTDVTEQTALYFSARGQQEEEQDDKGSEYFPSLREWIAIFLSDNDDMTASLVGNNMLVKQVLRLVLCLVKCGVFAKSRDIEKLLEPLMGMLEGSNDRPYLKADEDVLKRYRREGRFQKSVETNAIVDAKLQALDVLELLFNYTFNLRLQKFMRFFVEVLAQNANQQETGRQQTSSVKLLLKKDFVVQGNESVCQTALKRLQDIFQHTDMLAGCNIVETLLDLAHYDYDEMVCKSLHLLHRYFSARHTLFRSAVQAQILVTDSSVQVVRRLETLMPVLRRLSATKLSGDKAEELVTILDHLISMCHLVDEPEEPHGINQHILYNHGVLEDAFLILNQNTDVRIPGQHEGPCKVLQRTLVFLRAMARGNPTVQNRLFDRMDLMLALEGAEAETARCLTEVFAGNSGACMKVTSYQLHRVVSLAAQHGPEVPEFLVLVTAMMKVEETDLPIKRNQSLVMTYFMQYRGDLAAVVDQSRDVRENILTSRDSMELRHFAAMVDLLATCAEGENQYIESICQTIFSIDEVLRVLNHPGVSNSTKRSFLKFLLQVYMNTSGGMVDNGAGELPHDRTLWQYLDKLTQELNSLTIVVAAESKITAHQLKRPPGRSEPVPGDNEMVYGTLHYLFDAVMPFLQVFCDAYYQSDTETFPEEHRSLSSLTVAFEGFAQIVAPLVTIKGQMKNLVSTLMVLSSTTKAVPVSKIKALFQKYEGVRRSQINVSEAMKNYMEYYKAEEDLNGKLNTFAVNIQAAYGGLNTVRAQTGYPSDNRYSEVGGDEELPLGQEFQDHMKCFVDERATTAVAQHAMADKLVKQLQISQTLKGLSEEQKRDQVTLDVRCLQLLRGLIHNHIVRLPDGWEHKPGESVRHLRSIEMVQRSLNAYAAVSSVLGHLGRPEDGIVREVLAFLAALLFNGNGDVQESMLDYFASTREENFTHEVKNRLNLSAKSTREQRLLRALYVGKEEDRKAHAQRLEHFMASETDDGEILNSNELEPENSARSNGPQQNGSVFRLEVITRRPLQNLPGYQREAALPGGQGTAAPWVGRISLPDPPNHPLVGRDGSAEQTCAGSNLVRPSGHEELGPDLPSTAAQGEFEFKDDGFIELVLRVLGLMCDNQHKDLQGYLRHQPGNINVVNLVAEVTQYLGVVYGNIDDKSAPLVIQLIDTLVEFTSGNFENQAIVLDNKICEYLNYILRLRDFKNCTLEQVYTLRKSVAALIRSLTEENPPDSDRDANHSNTTRKKTAHAEVLEYMDSGVLMTTMCEAYKDANKKEPKWEEMASLVQETGFAYFHVLCRKMDLHRTCTKEGLVRSPEEMDVWDFFNRNTLSIEVVKNDVLQKVYFQVKDKKVLREEIKEKFKYDVDRSSPSNKLRAFMDWSEDIINDIKYQRRIHSNPLSRFLVQMQWSWNLAVLLVSLSLCLIVFITWRAPESTANPAPDMSEWPGAQYLIYILGSVHILLSLCVVVSYFLSNKPTFPDVGDLTGSSIPCLGAGKSKPISKSKGDIEMTEGKQKSHLEVKFLSGVTLYYLVFLASSVLGTVFYAYFFSFHLLHVILMNQLLNRVIQSVTRNGLSLILVALLGLVFIFIFSLVCFAFFRSLLDYNNGRQCQTSYECFVTVLHHGLVSGMYTTFEQQLNNLGFPYTLAVATFDVVFFIIISIIGLNIIFGIIVDTFAELRNAKWQTDQDMQNRCFICSCESYDFERQGVGFEKHVRHEHNQWAYVFFFIHLDETHPNDYSALELHVFRLWKQRSSDFFPLNRAMSLNVEEDSHNSKLETLMSQMEFLVNKIKEEESFKAKEREKKRQKEWKSKHKVQPSE